MPTPTSTHTAKCNIPIWITMDGEISIAPLHHVLRVECFLMVIAMIVVQSVFQVLLKFAITSATRIAIAAQTKVAYVPMVRLFHAEPT